MFAPLLFALLLTAPGARADPEADTVYARLRDPSPAVRALVCAELSSGTLRGPRAEEALSAALERDLSDQVRLAAGKALATYLGSGPLSQLERSFKSEPGPDLRRDLALALSTEPARRDDPESTRILAETLAGDPSPAVRLAISAALGSRGDPRALPAVRTAATEDSDKEVRQAAAQAAALLARPRPAPPRPAPRPEPKPDAVKGKDSCLPPWGWCERNKAFQTVPRCLTKPECRDRCRNLPWIGGSPCTWDGQEL
ncbi:MAG: HEAT repeat domain-containing protein [Elusimicrobiota bacterium]